MKKIAILLGADLSDGRTIRGGVVVVAEFIIRQLVKTGVYEPFLISTAVSHNDQNSVRLLSPSTWHRGVTVTEGSWKGIPMWHVGACFSDLEFQRYLPRSVLTDLLRGFDLIQVVAGSPAIGYALRDIDVPICLQMATTARNEREHLLRNAPLLRKFVGLGMLPIVTTLEKKALHLADHIFADTSYTADAIKSYVIDSKVTVDTIGVDVTKFSPAKERSEDFILCTGRLSDPRKNIRMLFQAYAFLSARNLDCPRLLLAGMTGPTAADWKCAQDLGIRDKISFMQSVSAEQLVKLYQNALCFVLSSDEEGLGIVLLEAMSCGTPVVSTACGGPDSVVEPGAGLLTPVGDPLAFAAGIEFLLKNAPIRQRMGEAARKLVERRFADEVVAQKYLNVFDCLLRT